jgi:hypothetical protein
VTPVEAICLACATAAIVAVVTVALMRGRGGSSAAPGSAHQNTDADPHDPRRDVRELQRELDALARQVEQRIDRKLGEMRQLLGQCRELAAKIERLGAYSANAAPAADREPREAPAKRTIALNGRSADVRRLADAGAPAVDIARELGMHIGEVELILNLTKPSPTADVPDASRQEQST